MVLTIRDQKNKAISEKLLELVAENYSIIDKFDIIRKKMIKGNGFREMTEPRIIFLFLLKKHTNLSYREINIKLACVTTHSHIMILVVKAENKLRNKANMEFIYQVRIIERDLTLFIKEWNQELIKNG